MIIAAVCLFLTGAVFGVYMFTRHLRRRAIPALAAVLHGGFGATAFGLVLLVMVRMPTVAVIRTALVILICAIVLGVVNLLFHVRRMRHRTILILIHAMTAVTGVGTLAYAGYAVANAPPGAPNVLPPGLPVPSATGEPVAMAAAIRPPSPSPSPAPSHAPSPAPAEAKPAFPPGPAWTDARLVFGKASTALDAQAQADLAEVVRALQGHPEITLVEVQGHTDERGDPATNTRLARARALAVADFLVSRGVSRSRIRAAGYGALCPADPGCEGPAASASCHEDSSYARDRRADLVILESGGERFQGNVACDAGMSLAPPADRQYVLR